MQFVQVEAYPDAKFSTSLDAASLTDCNDTRVAVREQYEQGPDFIDELEACRIAQCWHADMIFQEAWETLVDSCAHTCHAPTPHKPEPSLCQTSIDVWRCIPDEAPNTVLLLTDTCTPILSNLFPIPVEAPAIPLQLSSRMEQIMPLQIPNQNASASSVAGPPETTHESMSERQRPLFWVKLPWKRDLQKALDDLRLHVCNPEDETRKPIVVTWFLDHTRHRRCDDPREVQLEPDPSYWRRQIAATWVDLMDRNKGFNLHVGRPRIGFSGVHIADVLVVQSQHPHMASVLCTDARQGTARTWAAIMPTVGHKTAILRTLQITPVNPLDREFASIELRIGHDPIMPGVLIPVPNGIHFRTHDADTVDEVSMMQMPDTHVSNHVPASLLNHSMPTLPTPPLPVEAPAHRLSSRTGSIAWQASNWRPYSTVGHRGLSDHNMLLGTAADDWMQPHDDAADTFHEDTYFDILRRHMQHIATDVDLHVRTWYIRHRASTVCTAPRSIVFAGSDDDFHDSLMDLWRDQLDPMEDEVLISVAFPSTDDANDPTVPMVDILLSQGLEHSESAILMTVKHANSHRMLSRAAFSVWHWSTGIEILTSVHMNEVCTQHACSLWLGDHRIPLDTTLFETHDGQSFILEIRAEQFDDILMPQDSENDVPVMMEPPGHIAHAASDTSQGVWIHRLLLDPIFTRVDWSDFQALLRDCAQACQLRMDQIVAVHHVHRSVEGETDWDSSVIVQQIQDIPHGSTECLLLVDVLVHVDGQGLTPVPPIITRRVIRTPNQATRTHVLHYTMLEAFCHLQGDRCIVKHNGHLWPSQQIALRSLVHGDYLQVHVPPPNDEFIDISLEALLAMNGYGTRAQATAAHGWTFDAISMLQHSAVTRSHDSLDVTLDAKLRLCGAKSLLKLCQMIQEVEPTDAVHLMQTNHPTPHDTVQPPAAPMLDDQTFFTQFLHTAWASSAVQVCGENERHAVVMTWFIDFYTFQRCTQPRAIVLYEDFENWATEIERAWTDLIDPNEPVDLYQVLPPPPDSQVPTCAHVIVCQHAHVYKRAVMVSTYSRSNEVTRSVGLVDPATTEWDIQLAAGLGYECTAGHLRDRCACVFGGTTFTPSTTWTTHNGMHFYMLVDAPSIYAPHEPATNDVDSLLQISHGSTSLMNVPPQIGIDDCQPSDSSSMMQTVARPDLVNSIAHQPEFVRNLYDTWVETVNAGQRETPAGYLMTWYLDFYGHHVCTHPKSILLGPDFTLWNDRIMTAWQADIDHSKPVTLYRVHPQPMDRRLSLVAHVLVVQNEAPDRVPLLVTAYDHRIGLGSPTRLATFKPNPVGCDSLVQTVGFDDCLGVNPRAHCDIWHRNILLDGVYQLTNVVPGDQFMLICETRQCAALRPSRKRHISAVSLLQLKTQLRSGRSQPITRICLDRMLQPHDSTVTDALMTPLPSGEPMNPLTPPIWTKVNVSRVQFLRNCLHFPLVPQGQTDWKQFEWKPSTLWLLQGLPEWRHEHPIQLHFYTDGSADRTNEKAASAVFLLVETQVGWKFGGYHTFRPFTKCTAQSAEHCAIFGAVMWAIHIATQMRCQPQVTFFFDCYAAGFAAAGQWNSHVSVIPSVTRGLVLWLEEFVPTCQWTHTAAHEGNPGNEGADSLAHNAWLHDDMTCEFDTLWNLCTFDGNASWACEWLWYLERLHGRPYEHPCLIGHDLWYDISLPLQANPNAATHPFPQQSIAPDVVPARQHRLVVATANVLTLYPQEDVSGRYVSSRAESLYYQFEEHGIDLIGLQETRCKEEGHRRIGSYHVLSAAATPRGLYGVQLLIRARWTQHDVQIMHQDIRILASSPRFLIAAVHTSDVRLIIIVAHAPSHDGSDHVKKIWSEISHSIPARYHRWTTIALVDANARVGSLCTSAVGAHQCEEQNAGGEVFHEWLLQNQLYAPQTMEECHTGDGKTWSHATGKGARLDYVLVSQDISRHRIRTSIDDSIDLAITREDHKCVKAELWYDGWQASHPQSSHPAPSVLESQSPTWATDVHTHAAHLQHLFAQDNPSRPKKFRRKPHLTDSTWTLICAKRDHFMKARDAARTQRQGLLRAIFSAWRDQTSNPFCCQKWMKKCDMTIAWHQHQAKCLGSQVQKACRQDDVQFYEELAQQTAHVAHENPAKVWDCIRPLLPKTRRKRESSLRCCGPTVEERCAYYSSLEAGEFHSYDYALQQCCEVQKSKGPEVPLEIQLCNLPSRVSIEHLCRKVKTGKAHGLDGIHPEFWHEHGVQVAEQLCMLFSKAWLTAAEPHQFKGGRLFSISKRQASRRVEDLRGIMILDGLGKLYHTYLRAKLMETAQHWRQPMQLGGYVHQQTLFGTHFLRCLWKHTNSARISCAVLFLDLRSAFHTLLREHLTGQSDRLPETLKRVLQDRGFEIDAIEAAIDDHSTWFRQDVPPDVQRVLQDAHHATWFCIDGEPQICTTQRGSRPGSPLADLAFNALISHLIHELQIAINQIPEMREARAKLLAPTPILGWVDDLAVPMMTLNPQQLPSLIQQVTTLVHRACAKRGLELNFKPGKTEVVCGFRGSGAVDMRRQYLIEHAGHIALTEPPVLLRMVGTYEHLGMQFSQSGSVGQEIRVRVGKACSAHRTIRKGILQNKRVSVHARIRLAEALLVPILLHGSGSWPRLNHQSFVKVQAVLLTWFRSIANDGFWNTTQMTDLDFLASLRIPDLKTRLHKSRLLYAFQMMMHGPSPLLDHISAVDMHDPMEWTHALREAIQWISVLDDRMRVDAPLRMTIEEVFDWLRRHSHYGPDCVRRAYRRHKHLEYQMFETRQLHNTLKDIALASGVQFHAETTSASQSFSMFTCDDCDASFPSQQHLAAHRWRKHGLVSDERQFCFDAVCRSCQTCFWTIQRLQQHLKASRRDPNGCYCKLTWWCRPLQQLNHVVNPTRLHAFHRLPACRTQMPDFQPHQILTEDDAFARLDHEWTRNDFPMILPQEEKQQVQQRVGEVLSQVTSYKDEDSETALSPLIELLDSMRNECSHEEIPAWSFCEWVRTELKPSTLPNLPVDDYALFKAELWKLLHDLPIGCLLAWKWRMEEAYIPEVEVIAVEHPRRNPEYDWTTYTRQNDMIADIVGLQPCTFPVCTGIPVACYEGKTCIFVLHLFSGRRRRGDCHDWLQHLAPTLLPQYPVIMLSVDTAVSPEHGNLDRGPSFDIALRLCRRGMIAGVLTGPPCETWSAARHLTPPPECQERWPRPIRSASCPWSLPHVSRREAQQLQMGTRLMLHSWQLEVAVVLQGGGSLKEHPDEAGNPEFASTWRTRTHETVLMAAPNAHRHSIEQWRYGSRGVKPTCLRALNLGNPAISARVLKETEVVLPHRPHQGLQGKDSTGQFRTSAAKEYPSQLCCAIVATWLTGMGRRLVDEGARLCTDMPTPDEVAWIQSLSRASGEIGQGTFLPDYQGSDRIP